VLGLVGEQKLRETIIWLAGLLSTDGCVYPAGKKKNSLHYTISSSEREWLEQIAEKLHRVGMKTKIRRREEKVSAKSTIRYNAPYRVIFYMTICEPYLITVFLRKYAKDFMMERKWNMVLSAYPNGKKYTDWNSEEDQFLLKHYKTMSYTEIGRHLKRSSIERRVRILKQRGMIPNEDLRYIKNSRLAKLQMQKRRRRPNGTLLPAIQVT